MADIQIVIDDWEIECCAPPPVVGQPTRWRLGFVTSEGTPSELRQHGRWTARRADDGTTRLTRDGIEAFWVGPGEPPPPGEHDLRGHLSGTAHGGLMPEDVPVITGTVERVQVLSWEHWLDDRTVHRIPGTLRMREVRESPKWFTRPGTGRADTAVLVHISTR